LAAAGEKSGFIHTLLAAAADTVFGWRRRLNSAAAGRAEKFLGFLDFFWFLGFLGFNVHNAERPTTSSLHENICLLIHYLLQCKFPNLKVIGG